MKGRAEQDGGGGAGDHGRAPDGGWRPVMSQGTPEIDAKSTGERLRRKPARRRVRAGGGERSLRTAGRAGSAVVGREQAGVEYGRLGADGGEG